MSTAIESSANNNANAIDMNNDSLVKCKQNLDDDENKQEFNQQQDQDQEQEQQQDQQRAEQKTPMCYINEIARFNKLHPQYILQDEIGPAHKKTFFVTLKLADGEEYTAQGTSIKKAQQSAAQIALEKTKLARPPKRQQQQQQQNEFGQKVQNQRGSSSQYSQQQLYKRQRPFQHNTYTPTVRLNAFAMKLGYEPKYRFISVPPPIIQQQQTTNPSYTQSATSQQRPYFNFHQIQHPQTTYTSFTSNVHEPFCYPEYNAKVNRVMDNYRRFQGNNHQLAINNNQSPVSSIINQIAQPVPLMSSNISDFNYIVLLSIGNQTFQAEGKTKQEAKHNAACKALSYLSKFNRNNESHTRSGMNLMQNYRTTRRRQTFKTPQVQNNEIDKNEENKPNSNNIDDKNNETTLETPKTEKSSPNNAQKCQKNAIKQKSDISLVQDEAIKRNGLVKYELIQESGPSHTKKYTTRCSLDKYETIGEGKSKKESKRIAASKMLTLLKEKEIKILPEHDTNEKMNEKTAQDNYVDDNNIPKETTQYSQSQQEQRLRIKHKRRQNHKRKAKNIIQTNKVNPEYGRGSINPISRLIQIQQAKKECEPHYELIEEKCIFRKREFVMQVIIGEHKCIGIGSSKRIAKRNAAENMLTNLGYVKSQVPKPVLKTSNANQNIINSNTTINNANNIQTSPNHSASEKKVKFVGLNENDETQQQKDTTSVTSPTNINNYNNGINKQCLISQFNKISISNRSQQQQQQQITNSLFDLNNPKHREYQQQYKETLYITTLIANELLNGSSSQTGELLKVQKQQQQQQQQQQNFFNHNGNDIKNDKKIILNENSDYRDKLMYLADIMNFQVNFHSLSKKDEGISSYASISILPQTEKPFSGTGKTSNESCNAAALSALKYLADLGGTQTKSQTSLPQQNFDISENNSNTKLQTNDTQSN